MSDHSSHASRVTAGTLLVTLGIIYGDIGTSPLYVMKAIVGAEKIDETVVLGGLSCIFWTITLLTTFKYITLVLNADNKGEGGTFALYALVRRLKVKWLIIPAILGGCNLLADGMITPPISVSSAIEGLRPLYPNIPTIPIVIGILTALFLVQQFGTKAVGKFFGPVMLVWFSMLALWGSKWILENPTVFKAINPVYAYDLLVGRPGGFFVLGAVFLCATGVEALYSDLGHCGKRNVRFSWGFVKVALLLNYFGQGAWLLSKQGQFLVTPETMMLKPEDQKLLNPFFELMPSWFLVPGIIIATLATIVASQAMISGSFTLINEAVRLNLWPKVRIVYPTDLKGQLYVPSINFILFMGCIGVVLLFKESSKMEAAYGLAIVMTMIMTTIMLAFFMRMKRYPVPLIVVLTTFFLIVELAFLGANLEKFPHGGYVSLTISLVLFVVMTLWYYGKRVAHQFTEAEEIDQYKETLVRLSHDETIPRYATNLVFLTNVAQWNMIESKILYTIMKRQPKRADIYWFLHIHVVDEPYRMDYKVRIIAPGDIVRVDFYLGFRIDPRINLFFRKVVENMTERGEVDIRSKYASLKDNNLFGDFKFVMIEKYLSGDNDLNFLSRLALRGYFLLKKLSLTPEKAYGLETSSVFTEKFPLIVKPVVGVNLRRIEDKVVPDAPGVDLLKRSEE
jgi:KUP system potassium uptake protein